MICFYVKTCVSINKPPRVTCRLQPALNMQQEVRMSSALNLRVGGVIHPWGDGGAVCSSKKIIPDRIFKRSLIRCCLFKFVYVELPDLNTF